MQPEPAEVNAAAATLVTVVGDAQRLQEARLQVFAQAKARYLGHDGGKHVRRRRVVAKGRSRLALERGREKAPARVWVMLQVDRRFGVMPGGHRERVAYRDGAHARVRDHVLVLRKKRDERVVKRHLPFRAQEAHRRGGKRLAEGEQHMVTSGAVRRPVRLAHDGAAFVNHRAVNPRFLPCPAQELLDLR